MTKRILMNKKRGMLFIFVLVLLVLTFSVSASPQFIESSRNIVGNVFSKAGGLLENNQDSGTVKILDFLVFFVIFTSFAIVGLKKWGDDKNRRPVHAIAVSFGLALSLSLVWKTKISIVTLFPFATAFLVLALFILFYYLAQTLGIKSKTAAIVVAIILTWLFIYAFVGWGDIFKDLPGGSFGCEEGKGSTNGIGTQSSSGSSSSDTIKVGSDVLDFRLTKVKQKDNIIVQKGDSYTFEAKLTQWFDNKPLNEYIVKDFNNLKIEFRVNSQAETITKTKIIRKTVFFNQIGKQTVSIIVKGEGVRETPLTWTVNVKDKVSVPDSGSNSATPNSASIEQIIIDICGNKPVNINLLKEWILCARKIDNKIMSLK